jgi:hypothetical protein
VDHVGRRQSTATHLRSRQMYPIATCAFKTSREFHASVHRHFAQSGLRQRQERPGQFHLLLFGQTKTLSSNVIFKYSFQSMAILCSSLHVVL